MHGRNHFAFRFALFLIDFLERLFGRTQLGSDGFECGLLFAYFMLELHHFRVQSAQFALHAQRPWEQVPSGVTKAYCEFSRDNFSAAAVLSVKYAERSRGRNCLAAAPSGSRNPTSLSSREMTPSSARKFTIGSYSEDRCRFRSESTKKVARPPTSSRSMETPARA